MPAAPDARICFHCKQPIAAGEAHDCWTTTEQALTADLSEDLRDAWDRLRETASALGEQRIYASHNSIMFARKVCYCFVRPKRAYLELCIFLDREIDHPLIHRAVPSSKTKFAHTIRIRHRDEVEGPIHRWLEQAYALAPTEASTGRRPAPKKSGSTSARSRASGSGSTAR